jgi:hypothetical protein
MTKFPLTHPSPLGGCVIIASEGGEAVRFQSFRMRFFYIMGNHCLYKIQRFQVFATLESEQLKVTALNLFHPTASPPFLQRCVFSYYDTLSKGGLPGTFR